MPAFNEAEILATSVKSVVDGLRARGRAVRGRDRRERLDRRHARDRARASRREYPEVRVEHRDEADYGRALRAGLLDARGDAVVNFDTDYFDLDFLDAAVAQVLAPDGPAIVVGSKRGEGANDERDPIRKLATLVFSTILRVVFGLQVSDTHGIKAMRRAAVEPYARICTFGQDLFDTELILRVERAGLAHRRDPGRGARAPPGPQHVHDPRAAYAARTVQTPLGAVEGIPGSLTLAVRPRRQRRGRAVGRARPGSRSPTGGSSRPAPAPRRPARVDLGDALLVPGFVDVQVNGTGAVDFASAPVEQIVARGRRAGRRAARPGCCSRSAARRSTRTT